MGVAPSRLGTHVVFQAVTTVEKFADVPTNIVLEYEAATRVLLNKFADVEHQVVEDDEFTAVDEGLVKLFSRHTSCRSLKWNFLAQHDLVSYLSNDQEKEEKEG